MRPSSRPEKDNTTNYWTKNEISMDTIRFTDGGCPTRVVSIRMNDHEINSHLPTRDVTGTVVSF